MQQLELGLGNITVDEFGISVMLLSFISIEKNANRMVRVFFRRHQLFFVVFYFFKVGIYDIIVFLCRSIGLCALVNLGFGLRLRVNHFAQFLAGCAQCFGFGIDGGFVVAFHGFFGFFQRGFDFSFSAASSLSP